MYLRVHERARECLCASVQVDYDGGVLMDEYVKVPEKARNIKDILKLELAAAMLEQEYQHHR